MSDENGAYEGDSFADDELDMYERTRGRLAYRQREMHSWLLILVEAYLARS